MGDIDQEVVDDLAQTAANYFSGATRPTDLKGVAFYGSKGRAAVESALRERNSDIEIITGDREDRNPNYYSIDLDAFFI